MTYLSNLHRVFDKADSIDVNEGLVAYTRYRDTMQRFADYYKFTLEQVTAAFCALSPNNDYKGNIKSMATVLHGIRCGWSCDQITVTTYNACRNRAYEFATGKSIFMEKTKGPKTRAFFQNILDPSDSTPVTVDGHMLNIWHNEQVTMVEAVRRRTKYEDVAQGIRQLAFSRCLIPNQAQAILWFTWKRINSIVFESQLSLFSSTDQWGTNVLPQYIKPFQRKIL